MRPAHAVFSAIALVLALALVALPARAGDSPPSAGTPVLVLLPTMGPEGVSVEALNGVFELYARDYKPMLLRVHLGGAAPDQQRQALEWGRSKNARLVAYLTFDPAANREIVISAFVFDVSAPSRKNEGFSMRVPGDPDAPTRRALGLRFRSMLQAASLEAASSEPEPPPIRRDAEERPKPEAPPPPKASPHQRMALEAHGSASAAWSRPLVPGAGLGAWMLVDRFALGLEARVTFPFHESSAIGEGRVSSQTLLAGGRLVLGPVGSRLGVALGLGLGARRVETETTVGAGGPKQSETDYVPAAELSVAGRLGLTETTALFVGPYLLGTPTIARARVDGGEVIASEYIEFGAHAKIQFLL